MTTFKCHICGSHWTEGPTRDHFETACRKCIARTLEEIWKAFDDAVDWGQDCMGYALQGWDWKYGEYWRDQEARAIEAKRELKNIIIELRIPLKPFEGGGTCLEDCDA